MQTEQTNCVHKLEPGQLWKMEHGYVQILELGRRHVYYKMLRQPQQKAALTRMIGIEAMLRFLQSEAVLVAQPQEVQPGLNEAPVLASPKEPAQSAEQWPVNGLTMGLLGKDLEPQSSGVGTRFPMATTLSCLCSRGVSQLQSLLRHARHPA